MSGFVLDTLVAMRRLLASPRKAEQIYVNNGESI